MHTQTEITSSTRSRYFESTTCQPLINDDLHEDLTWLYSRYPIHPPYDSLYYGYYELAMLGGLPWIHHAAMMLMYWVLSYVASWDIMDERRESGYMTRKRSVIVDLFSEFGPVDASI